jgi:hypothetical protein
MTTIFKTDTYFEIGSTHDICQDYALAGNISNNIAFAIVTDGCSESHKMCNEVDFGARVVAYSARDAICSLFELHKELPNDIHYMKTVEKSIRQKTLLNIKPIKDRLRLHDMFSDSTLVITLTDGKIAYTFIYGDGGVIVTKKNNTILYNEISFASSAPYYIVYTEDKNRNNGYRISFGSQPVTSREFILEPNKPDIVNSRQTLEFSEKLYDFSSYMFDDFSSIVVTSDGAKSYQKINEASKEIESQKMIRRFTTFKNTNGCYLQRRMKMLKKECETEIVSHYDDVSVAGIIVG